MTKVYIFNPLNEDFDVKYDINNDRNPVTFTIKAKETASYEKVIADHFKQALAVRIFDLRGNVRKDRDIQMKEIYKEIEIKI